MAESTNPRSHVNDAAWGGQLMFFLARVVAYPSELITRRWGTMGREYPHPVIVLCGVFIVPIAFAALLPPAWGGGFLLLFPGVLLILCACHNVRRMFRREHIHREYVGVGWWGEVGSRGSEVVVGLAAAAIGFLLCPTLGILLVVSLACSQLNLQLIEFRDRRIIDRMKDAQIDAAYYGQRMRDDS